MWFFLFGNKSYQDHLGYIITRCPQCRTTDVFSVEQERKKVTFFFVPTFQYSKKQFMVCTNCRQIFEVADELKPELAGRLMGQEELKSALEQKRLKNLAGLPHCSSCHNVVGKEMFYCPQCGHRLK